jgi:hypothetical protein
MAERVANGNDEPLEPEPDHSGIPLKKPNRDPDDHAGHLQVRLHRVPFTVSGPRISSAGGGRSRAAGPVPWRFQSGSTP